MAELEPPYDLAFEETLNEVLKRLANERGTTEAEVLGSALKAHAAREQQLASIRTERRPTDPECEIGIRTGEFDIDLLHH